MNEPDLIIPDRYNSLGQWKPLIFPGSQDDLEKFTSNINHQIDDEEVEGTLFYTKVTGKLVIEFVVRTSLQLPSQPYNLQPNIHLWACPLPHGTTINNQNIIVYDGWMDITNASPDSIKKEINYLRQTLHKLAFAFKASITWRLKYLPSFHASGITNPDLKEFIELEWFFNPILNDEEAIVIDSAIDWFNIGSTSSNPLTRFLCYFIALESIVIAITDGEAKFGLQLPDLTKTDLQTKKTECINNLATELLISDPISFATKAYFECVQSLKKRLKIVMEQVFGPTHIYLDLLFSNSKGLSLADIRSKIAHGKITMISNDDEKLIHENIYQMSVIAHEFILRICYSSTVLKPTNFHLTPNQFSQNISFSDPRTINIMTTDCLLPPNDWKIRPEWCDS